MKYFATDITILIKRYVKQWFYSFLYVCSLTTVSLQLLPYYQLVLYGGQQES